MKKTIAAIKKLCSISELQTEWSSLHELDRAVAVRDLHNSGIPNRKIADQLHKPESSLRRLLEMLDAPVVDRLLFRQGKITGNELVRRSRAAGLQRAARQREDLKLQRETQTLKAADRISKWLLETHMNRPNREMIVNDARQDFHTKTPAELCPIRVPPGTPIDRIIEQTRPPDRHDSIDIAGWYTAWLCCWTSLAFPDPDIRDNAIDIALQQQSKW